MKKILLITPPTGLWVREDRCQSPIEKTMFAVIRPPLRLGLATAILEEASCKCVIADYPAEDKGWESFKKDLKQFEPDILFVSTVFKTRNDDFQACRIAKDHNKNILTIMKGSPLGDDTGALEKCAELDIFLTKEIDRSLISIISGENLHQTTGITFRENGRIIKTSPAPFIKNLDSLPFIARHLLKNDLYCRPDTMKPLTVIQASRGCPFKCIFCSAIIGSGKILRKRSPQNIVDEIEECINKYEITNFLMGAETFTCDKKWVIDICDEILKRGLKVNWYCNSRVDTIDRELAGKMKKSGCYAVSLGVESGNQETLDKMKKGTTLAQAVEAIRVLKETKIKTYLYYIIGFPWETREMIVDTINFALKLDGDISDFYLAHPLHGTELHEMAKESGILEHDKKLLFEYRVNSPLVSVGELNTLYRMALRRFYLRPKY
ncbi:MAG: B12-binding domain-containing radical SAM protein, partial [Candidatus Anammoxibacter sp.]